MYSYYLTIVLAPLAAAIIAGLAGKKIGRAGAHGVPIIGVGISCGLSFLVLKNMVWGGAAPELSLIHISEPTRQLTQTRIPS